MVGFFAGDNWKLIATAVPCCVDSSFLFLPPVSFAAAITRGNETGSGT